MAAPPEPPDEVPRDHLDDVVADRLERAVERVLARATNGSAPGSGPPSLSVDKAVHNEIIKLKANTLNAAAIAFFVGGVIAPLVSTASQGLTFFQIAFGLVWLFLGFLLHFMAQRVLKSLRP